MRGACHLAFSGVERVLSFGDARVCSNRHRRQRYNNDHQKNRAEPKMSAM
jgi:hypothetical protein